MSLRFSINNKIHQVNSNVLPKDITLLEFIRNNALLTGAKFMCLEGGCGSCSVSIRRRNPFTLKFEIISSNSCLTLLNVCNGYEITTVEGIGDKKVGYHPIQKKLASMNGSQCGYCSTGMVMNMYSLLAGSDCHVTMKEVEDSFSGNLCRCTGYRPILDAMKSFAVDAIDIEDIEDLPPKCNKSTELCQRTCVNSNSGWFWPKTIEEIFDIFDQIKGENYMLVGGNTAHGVYRRQEDISIFIDVNDINDLHSYEIGNELILGGNVTLANAIKIFRLAQTESGFEYCEKVADHFELIANTPVRNMGTLAGNIMLKKQHREFPSDVFILFESLNAKINVCFDKSSIESLTLEEFISRNLFTFVIKSFSLPKQTPNSQKFNSYKVTVRAQNAHAYVNGAFLFDINFPVVNSARICFGGINPNFVHAKATELYLEQQNISDEKILETVFRKLLSELDADWVLPDASPVYRKYAACGILYKFILSIFPKDKINGKLYSGIRKLYEDRSISSGAQYFQTIPKNYPLTQPVIKREALVQCSGEAMYNNDLPPQPNEVYCAFVQAKVVGATIEEIDPSEALSMKKVLAFFSAKDIPGENTFTVPGYFNISVKEEIFASENVLYYDQPLGVIAAETMSIAVEAAKKVKVFYSRHPLKLKLFENTSKPISNLPQTINGYFNLGGQYHFTLEPQTSVCVPEEDGYRVYCSTQYMDLTQAAMSKVINVPQHTVQLDLRRVGGAYGSKVSRASLIGCTSVLVAHLLNRPARFVQTIEAMMETIGKRFPYYCTYETDFTSKGRITSLSADIILDGGCYENENASVQYGVQAFPNCYSGTNRWNIRGSTVLTDAASNTIMRGPGKFQCIAVIENIMEHIAFNLGLDSSDVRLENIAFSHPMNNLYRNFLTKCDYKQRQSEIIKFNRNNLWRKKGIASSVMEFAAEPLGIFQATVSIYHGDGSVAICHGASEMGQGLNTKVIQVAAFTLGIPMSFIKIEPSNTLNGANSVITANSAGSESVSFAVRNCCQKLLARLKKVKQNLKPNASWKEVVEEAHKRYVSLIASDIFIPPEIPPYKVYGCSCSEVEYDVLTGATLIHRVDIVEDTGESISPLIDVGQIEGSFVTGLGYWFSESLVYDRQTGRILTNRTWNYKVPGAKDIPVDFRVELIQLRGNDGGFLRSKATGEPATCLAVSAYLATRKAIEAVREDLGLPRIFLNIGPPASPENNLIVSGIDPSMFKLQ